MTTIGQTPVVPQEWFRKYEGLGAWEGKGKVVAVGVGHSPTARRWDGAPETSIGALAIDSLRRAAEDAGVPLDQVDGLVMDPTTTTGAYWPEDRPIPEDFLAAFKPGLNRMDGINSLSTEWILNNFPELSNIQFTMYASTCMSQAICVAAEAVARGLTKKLPSA